MASTGRNPAARAAGQMPATKPSATAPKIVAPSSSGVMRTSGCVTPMFNRFRSAASVNRAPPAANAPDYARVVYDLALRRDLIGFIFQAPYLIQFLDVTDNVALLPMLAGKPNALARKEARELLEALDVAHRAAAMPSQLSGGEQQRVSIARALVNRPPVILADEPTAPLDSQRSLIVMRLLTNLAEQYQTAIIVVTHDDIIIPRFKRLYRLRDGVAYEEAGQGLPFPD